MGTFDLDEYEVDVVAKEWHKINATDENLQELIASGGELPNGFIGAVEVPASILDNLVTYGVIPKQLDDNGIAIPKKKFKEAFFCSAVVDDKSLIRLCETHSPKSYNSSRTMDIATINGLLAYLRANNYSFTVHTKSTSNEIARNYIVTTEEI